jgi:transcriptional regulator with XRE-family HTH domain
LAVGRRIRELRREAGLSLDELATRGRLPSKGHLSNLEHGLVRPNIRTLAQIARGLGVMPLDLLTFPSATFRERLVDMTRALTARHVMETIRWLRESAAGEERVS